MRRARRTNPDQAPWQDCWVWKIVRQPHTHGRRYALIRGWPTPVSELARTVMPPAPGRPVYGYAARQWAKAQLDANRAPRMRKRPKAERRWLGAYTLRWLRTVAAGRRALRWAEYHSLRTYWAPQAAAPPPQLRVQVGGGGVRLGWSRRSA